MVKFKILYTSFLLILISSCNSQELAHSPKDRRSQTDTNALEHKRNQEGAIGDTVSKMDNSILVVFQDRNNNYWFGSKGVYRYDGKVITQFTIEDGLSSNSIIGIQEDKFGNIYFDTSKGVNKFDGQKITTLEVFSSKFSKNEWKLAPDDLWFRMGWDKNGPYRYDGHLLYQLEFPKTDQADEFYSKYPNASYTPYGIYTLYKDREGAVWFGTTSLGVCRYDGKSISWLYERQLTKTSGDGDFGIRSIIEDRDGYFWFCNTRYRYKILPDSTERNGSSHLNYRRENGISKSAVKNEQEVPYFMSIVEDDTGDLWMATYDDGVWRNNGQELIHYPIKDGDTDVLLFSIYKDHQGVLWLGTHNAGVYKYNGSGFEKFEP